MQAIAKDTKSLENNTSGLEAQLKKFFEGFDKDWEERNAKIAEQDKATKEHINVEIVRHIQEHWIKRVSKRKDELTTYMKEQNKEMIKCGDSKDCKEKVQKIIDWIEKSISNMCKIIQFFE